MKIRETFLGYEVVGYVTSYNGDAWEVIVDTFQTRKEAETFLEKSGNDANIPTVQ